MKVDYENDQYAIRAKVYPFGKENEDWRTWIDVRRDGLMHAGKWPPASINWPALGAREWADTEAFAKGLLVAVDVAKFMNKPVEMYTVVLDVKMAKDGSQRQFTRLMAANSLNQIVDSIKEGVDSDGNIVALGSVCPATEEDKDA